MSTVDVTEAVIVPLEKRGPNQAAQRLALFDEDGNPFLLTPLGKRLNFITELSGEWECSNPSVAMTSDGLVFGPYPDGKVTGGSLRYMGLNEQPLSAVSNLSYLMRFTSDTKNLEIGASPYLRIFTVDSDGTAHDAIFTPGSQSCPALGQGPIQEFAATAGTWRYDDDSGSGGVPFHEIVANYGDHIITKICVTLGWTDGENLSGLLRWMQVNGNRYTFGG